MDGSKSSEDGSDGSADGQTADLHDKLKFLKEEVEYNRNRINALEGRLSALDPLRRTYSGNDAMAAPTEVTDDTDGSQEYVFLTARKTIPEVRECNYAQFKNRFERRGKDGRYAVDVLVAGLLLPQEILQERKLRELLFEQRGSATSTRIVKDKAMAKAVQMANTTADLISQAQAGGKWPRRIRIQAPALLRILARVNKENWSDRQRTYYRPFSSLIYQHPEIKNVLKELEERWGSQLDGDSTPNADDADDANGKTENDEDAASDSREDDEDSIDDSPEALACLRAYVKYIDEKIMPDYHRFEKLDVSSNASVRFSDLWYLFRTGEFVYRQVDGELPDRRDFRTGKRIWKTYYVDPVLERMMPAASDNPDIKETAVESDDSAFTLGCYYVDHTGEEFCVVKKPYRIEQFAGEMPVSALPIFPMRFCRGWKDRLAHAVETGDSLVDLMKARHCFYSGWTLTRDPGGEPTTDAKGVLLDQPEHINSEVMVDFSEAYQACPHWRPQRASMREKLVEGKTVPEDFRIRWWSGVDRASLLGETTEVVPVRSGVTPKQRNEYVSEDPFLKAVSKNIKCAQLTTEEYLTEDAKALLTGRMYAYVFQERKFAQLSVAKLRPSPKTGLALESLKIPQRVKHAIQGSVQGHFLQKNAERKLDQDWVSLDLIQGKGTGLFILLHGVPGVGKTATAEAIAQANGKPLFKITVGDLGMTPEKLEISLREIFRLASIWDCILLLDEVDTFFSQRSRADTATNKNAMVSVFLRVLDYYNGILFLTTNRAGVLDEAFKSRIHYKIYYPDLTLEQTLDIWKLNIQRVRKIEEELAKVENRGSLVINEDELLAFAKYRFQEGGSNRYGGRGHGRWNGRQIRNAFQVACSLAYYEHGLLENEQRTRQQSAVSNNVTGSGTARDILVGPPILSVHHFETMHEITASFENYRTAVHGGTTDADLALEAEARHDSYRDGLTEDMQAEYRIEHLKLAAAAGGDGVTGEIDYNKTDASTAVMTNRLQRVPHSQQVAVGNDFAPTENYVTNSEHRGSQGSRLRSGSYLPNPNAPSPPNVGFNNSQGQQQSIYPVPSPRQGAMRDNLSGSPNPSGGYLSGPPPRTTGYQAPHYGHSPPGQNYSHSPRTGSGNNQGPFGYPPQSQYGNEGGGLADVRYYTPKGDYFGPGRDSLLPPGREGLGMVGGAGPHDSRGWGVPAGQNYMNPYTGQGRDQQLRPVETDLSPDEVFNN
ncbi:hypothetical protein L207DRAFT_500180 [Hyaloscypha variabilis F]|uniref:AAA+ ATPase domain-containing protein n=1 Tax=Hyaloscypha variabilis (strain UAMH 11265 / GT02V1 / F) TaxID=1149755 RepID=A0A2J6R1R8_HYAVF|nr:hypothetical protein L207DRAFT_500180 [Hyaloscypha variabilis F]